MSRLSKLFGEPKEIKIAGETFVFRPLTLKNIELITKLENEDTRPEAFREIVMKTLKDAVPEATPDEINQVGVSHFSEIVKAIIEVNGLTVPEMDDVIKAKNK